MQPRAFVYRCRLRFLCERRRRFTTRIYFPRPRSSLLRIAKIAHAVPNKPAETLKASAVVRSHPFSSRAKYVHIGSTKFSHAIKTQAHKNPSFSNTRTELYIAETYLPHLL
jgi:hypothetical protein